MPRFTLCYRFCRPPYSRKCQFTRRFLTLTHDTTTSKQITSGSYCSFDRTLVKGCQSLVTWPYIAKRVGGFDTSAAANIRWCKYNALAPDGTKNKTHHRPAAIIRLPPGQIRSISLGLSPFSNVLAWPANLLRRLEQVPNCAGTDCGEAGIP